MWNIVKHLAFSNEMSLNKIKQLRDNKTGFLTMEECGIHLSSNEFIKINGREHTEDIINEISIVLDWTTPERALCFSHDYITRDSGASFLWWSS